MEIFVRILTVLTCCAKGRSCRDVSRYAGREFCRFWSLNDLQIVGFRFVGSRLPYVAALDPLVTTVCSCNSEVVAKGKGSQEVSVGQTRTSAECAQANGGTIWGDCIALLVHGSYAFLHRLHRVSHAFPLVPLMLPSCDPCMTLGVPSLSSASADPRHGRGAVDGAVRSRGLGAALREFCADVFSLLEFLIFFFYTSSLWG